MLEDPDVRSEDVKAAGRGLLGGDCGGRGVPFMPQGQILRGVQRAMVNSLARRVKLADLQDNLDLTRIPDPGPEDWERVKRYHRARQAFLSD